MSSSISQEAHGAGGGTDPQGHPSSKCDVGWATEVLSFQVAAGSHTSSHGEFTELPHLTKGLMGRSHGHSPKGRWEDEQKQTWSKTPFMYMVYSSQSPCCNPSRSMELLTASSHRGLLPWGWISKGGVGKKRRA